MVECAHCKRGNQTLVHKSHVHEEQGQAGCLGAVRARQLARVTGGFGCGSSPPEVLGRPSGDTRAR